MKKKTAEKPRSAARGIKWIHMGPWPVQVGITQSQADFIQEMKSRLIEPDQFLAKGSVAELHTFTRPTLFDAPLCCIVAVGDISEGTETERAAVLAHEAMHVIQAMRDSFGNLGIEAEGYIIQYLTNHFAESISVRKRARKS